MRLNPNDRYPSRPPPTVAGGAIRGAVGPTISSASSSSASTAPSVASSSPSPSAPSFEYEFGGPIGAFLTMISLPLITLLLTRWAAEGRVVWEDASSLFHLPYWSSTATTTTTTTTSSCSSSSSSSSSSSRLLHYLCPSCDGDPYAELLTCAAVVVSWFAFQVILERVLPCELVDGAPLPLPAAVDDDGDNHNGHGGKKGGTKKEGKEGNEEDEGAGSTRRRTRLTYRINGHLAFWVTLLLLDVGWPSWTDVAVVVVRGGGGGGGAATAEEDIATATVGGGGPRGPWWWSRPGATTNATAAATTTTTAAARSVLTFGRAPLTWLCDRHSMLAFATILCALCLTAYLYAKSFAPHDGDGGDDGEGKGDGARRRRPPLLAAGGNSGNRVYDFFMGRELNPRSLGGTFDWKEFCELRPGLIGWMVLNLAMLAKQRERLGYVTGSMILVNIFQGSYVWDALYQERAILTTMDITTDGFGYMLVFGDLAWVPYTYGLQARYLVDHDPLLPWQALVAIVGVNALGYAVFRGANSQKDAFRRDPDSPDVRHLSYLRTTRGTRLLTGGWWGLARKINYTGDWIMGLSWCMLCGFDSIVPYFYAVYFAVLLVHRSIRDDRLCREKYGDDWDRYRSMVPYRFIPGIV